MNISPERKKIDELAERAGGYFSLPSEDSMAYTELLFDICQQFGIRYYTATKKERYFVEEVTRVTWATGGKIWNPSKYPARIFHLPHILTHTGNIQRK